MTNKDLFHDQGNKTVKMPKKIKNKVGITDPLALQAGKSSKVTPKVQRGWNK